ncbi:MAG: M20/M25/M40 family metallo-hydrolase [Thermomicrobiales bacterium]
MSLTQNQRAYLLDLLTTPSPSGFERHAARRWREEATNLAPLVDHDIAGNSWASNRDGDGLHIVIEGHIDEIGLIITSIDDNGFLWIDRIGGWDDQVVVGQRIMIDGRNGPVTGVIGKKAAHLLKPADREKVTTLSDVWIDIGAKDRSAAQAVVEVGDPAVVDVTPLDLPNDLLVSRSIDNRIGSFIALEVLRSVIKRDTPYRVTALAASQEEITMAGAINAAHNLKPDVVIALDVTHATDYPGAEPQVDNKVSLGGGPVLTRGSAVNQRVFEALRDAAKDAAVPFVVQAAGRSTGTDADGFRRSGIASAIGLVSIPNRYMHSPNELISLTDVAGAIALISTCVANLSDAVDFRD